MYLKASFESGSMRNVNFMADVIQVAPSIFLAYFNTQKEA